MLEPNVATTEVPEDFEAFEKWRTDEETPAADEAKTDPDPDPESTQENEEEQQTDKTVKGVQKRIDELTKARREAERRAEAAEAKLANQGSRPATETAQPVKPAAADGKPKLEDFDTLEAFQEALTDFKLDQREKTRAAETARSANENVARAAQAVWDERETAYKAENPDYDQTLESVEIPNTPAVPAIRQALAESDIGPKLLHALAKNPDELKRITALSPASAIREIGKLEGKLLSATTPEKPQPKISSAPRPPARVGGTAPAAKAIDDPDLPYEEFEKRRNARDRRR